MSDAPTLSQVLALLERRADPRTAEEWDRVGLVCGDPVQPVSLVDFAVDATPGVVADAVAGGADLLVTHHPLLLRGVHGLAETTSRGRSLSRLIRAGCALFTMHTNADQASGGVNDALADALGISPAGRTPIRPADVPSPARVIVYVPDEAAERVVDALGAAGAGRLGDYDSCAYWVEGTGQFRPLEGARPYTGEVGSVTRVAERRVEMVFPRDRLASVIEALRVAHPYEEPAFSVVDSMDVPGSSGLGRIGNVPATTLSEFARIVAEALPANAAGVRVAGDPRRPVRRVAVCGGAGDSLLSDVGRAGVDAYVTSDLRHHPAGDFLADNDIALIDVPHASGEALWLRSWADQLVSDARAAGLVVRAKVNPRNTDPWTMHLPTGEDGRR